MSHFLSPGQRALLQQLLQMRLHELERRAALRLGAAPSDREPAQQELQGLLGLQEQGGEAVKRSLDHALALARVEHERTETAAVRDALARVHDATFGQCADCGSAIAFDRLKLEPWALRCVACEAALERRSGAVIPRSTI